MRHKVSIKRMDVARPKIKFVTISWEKQAQADPKNTNAIVEVHESQTAAPSQKRYREDNVDVT